MPASIKPLVWMRAIRDDPRCTTVARLAVLWALALRMRADGSGYASAQMLMGDTEVCKRTVMYALAWARRSAYLDQTRRGHRLGSGQVIASEWQLSIPESQGARDCTLDESQGARGESQGANEGPQGARRAPPRGQVSKSKSPRDDATQRANGQPWDRADVLSVVMDSLKSLSGKDVDEDFARREARRLLDDRDVRDPCRYVKGALKKAADEGRLDDHLPTPTPPTYAEVEHRRHCDKYGLYWPEDVGVACTCNPRYSNRDAWMYREVSPPEFNPPKRRDRSHLPESLR